MRTKLDIWKTKQEKAMRRRNRVNAYNRHYRTSRKKFRMKGGPRGSGGTFQPMNVEASILNSVLGLMLKDKIRKQQGQRGA